MPHWRDAEAEILTHHVQLTSDEQFLKAGEAYFRPDGKWIIFQAIPQPKEGEEAEKYYSMYVANIVYDEAGHITGLDRTFRISLPGSANTCGFFNPAANMGTVFYASTIDPPILPSGEVQGYQRESGAYKWMFPDNMEIVYQGLPFLQNIDEGLQIRIGYKPEITHVKVLTQHAGYDAEGSISSDGRYYVWCRYNPEEGEGDLWIYDAGTGTETPIIVADGYDGGPFFSPDDKRLIYRSDRRGDGYLQVYAADLVFDEDGRPTGISREYELTNDGHVNWAPFWHPQGRHVVYTTSQQGHWNYEVYIMDADPGDLPTSPGPVRYGTNKRRVTHAAGFDGLPVFSFDGKYMMWTSQRTESATETGSSQLWAAEFVMDIDAVPADLHGGARRQADDGHGH